MMSLFAESRVETHSEKKKSPDGRSGSPTLGMPGGPQAVVDWKESSSCPKKTSPLQSLKGFFFLPWQIPLANHWRSNRRKNHPIGTWGDA